MCYIALKMLYIIGWHRYRLPLSRAYRYRLALARAYRYR